MSSGLLMTSTLLDSFDWYQTCPSSWRDSARAELLAKIRRESAFKPTAEVRRGMDFETVVNRAVNKPFAVGKQMVEEFSIERNPTWDLYTDDEKAAALAALENIYSTIRGYVGMTKQQEKLAGNAVIDDTEYYFFGFADFVSQDNTKIYDLKTTTAYKDVDKYLRRAQHLMYCYLLNCLSFKYLVVDFAGGDMPTKLEVVDASQPDKDVVTETLFNRVRKLKAWLDENNLWDDYVHKFARR